jgi:hypothetical protein
MLDTVFDVRAPRLAPFGLVGWIFIGGLLGGIPLMGLAVMISAIPAGEFFGYLPYMIFFLFPIAMLYGLWRLFARFRLSILTDGTIIFVEPFKTTRIAKGTVATANFTSTYVHASKARMNWLVLGDAQGNKLGTISPMSFGADALIKFIAALQKVQPDVKFTEG